MNNKANIIKIVYFDEGSATDYIQINQGGELSSVMELFDEKGTDGEAKVEGKVGIKAKALKALLGLGVSVDTEGHLSTSFNSGELVKSIVSNTVLTDFLKAANNEEQETAGAIKLFTGYRIEQIQGSLSSFTLLTPYLSMFKGGQGFSAGEYDISIDKLDSTLNKAKGYLEFLGCSNDDDILLRFNSNAFKNNYRPSDLLKMDLALYAIKVGSCHPSELIADNELKFEGVTQVDNPDYSEEQNNFNKPDEKEILMYDVILAGVNKDAK
jgi:hypothetical protein